MRRYISLYNKQAVEYYSATNDPKYELFKDKIKSTLSSEKLKEFLDKETNNIVNSEENSTKHEPVEELKIENNNLIVLKSDQLVENTNSPNSNEIRDELHKNAMESNTNSKNKAETKTTTNSIPTAIKKEVRNSLILENPKNEGANKPTKISSEEYGEVIIHDEDYDDDDE